MDNKVLEVALQAYMDGWCKSVEGTKRCIATWDDETDVAHARAGVRAAILASLPVLLGEPVAWAHPLDVDAVADANMETGNVMRLFPTDRGDMPRVALYAPSLGEGDESES